MAYRHENLYRVYVVSPAEILITILGQESDPVNPLLLHDGGGHALLRRNRIDVVILDGIPPTARGHVKAAESVTIVELNEVDGAAMPRREYSVPVRVLEKLPIDLELLMAE